jgi:rhodanese-related sulfurtransferase
VLKSLVNLPFRVLGRAARAVQRHQDGVILANYGAGKADDPPPPSSGGTTGTGFDTPPEFDPPELALDLPGFQREMRAGNPWILVDLRENPLAKLDPEAQEIPLSELNMRLAELPPEPSLLLFLDDQVERAHVAARFVRFRGHEGARWLRGGIAAWRAQGGRP